MSGMKRRSLPPKEQARFISAPSVKMDLQNLLIKPKMKNETEKIKKIQIKKGSGKGRDGR